MRTVDEIDHQNITDPLPAPGPAYPRLFSAGEGDPPVIPGGFIYMPGMTLAKDWRVHPKDIFGPRPLENGPGTAAGWNQL